VQVYVETTLELSLVLSLLSWQPFIVLMSFQGLR
jgi:hypothetical protein